MTRLIEALCSDLRVTQALKHHGVAKVPAFGPIWARFPQPAPLTPERARDLYEGCGVALAHVELLTGQPSETVRKHLAGWGIPVRPPGGRCPFLRLLTHDEKQCAEPRTWCLAEPHSHFGQSLSRQLGLDQSVASPRGRTNPALAEVDLRWTCPVRSRHRLKCSSRLLEPLLELRSDIRSAPRGGFPNIRV